MWSEVEGAAADAFELTDGNFLGSAGEARPRYTSGSSSKTAEAHAWLASNPIVSACKSLSAPHMIEVSAANEPEILWTARLKNDSSHCAYVA